MSKTFDRYAGVAFFLIGLLFIIESQRISESAYGSNVGPGVFPTGLGVLLIILSIRLIYETFKYKKEEAEVMEIFHYKKFLIVLISAIIYAFIMESIGYILSTFLFLLIAFQTMERGKWMHSIIISLAFSAGVYYFFVEFLGGTLPRFPLF